MAMITRSLLRLVTRAIELQTFNDERFRSVMLNELRTYMSKSNLRLAMDSIARARRCMSPMLKSEINIKIVNVVVSVTLQHKLDLNAIVKALPFKSMHARVWHI